MNKKRWRDRNLLIATLVDFLKLMPPPPGSKAYERAIDEANRTPLLKAALEREKREGHKLAVGLRTIAFLTLGLLLPFWVDSPNLYYYEFLLLIFIAVGWLQLRFSRVGRSRLEMVLLFFDILLLTAAFIIPSPFQSHSWPSSAVYQSDVFSFFYIILASATLAYSWRTIISLGVFLSLSWIAGALLINLFGYFDPALESQIQTALGTDADLFSLINPNTIGLELRLREVVVFMLVAFILAAKSWRSNQLLFAQARLAVQRANLSRYFPPALADQIANKTQALGEIRSQEVAVLFVDIVGFTKIAEKMPPKETIEMLREFHQLMADCVFSNNGTLDKFLGDGIMATFGTPFNSPHDAENALKCGLDMRSKIEDWTKTHSIDSPVIKIGIGIHFGSAILGDIGTQQRVEFAALGDVVNVAARLEAKTRELNCTILTSQALVERAGTTNKMVVENLIDCGNIEIKGRNDTITVWKNR